MESEAGCFYLSFKVLFETWWMFDLSEDVKNKGMNKCKFENIFEVRGDGSRGFQTKNLSTQHFDLSPRISKTLHREVVAESRRANSLAFLRREVFKMAPFDAFSSKIKIN